MLKRDDAPSGHLLEDGGCGSCSCWPHVMSQTVGFFCSITASISTSICKFKFEFASNKPTAQLHDQQQQTKLQTGDESMNEKSQFADAVRT